MGLKGFFKKTGRVVTFPVRKSQELVMNEVLKGVVRHVITAVGTAVFGQGVVSGSEIEALTGGVAVIISVVASVLSKKTLPRD